MPGAVQPGEGSGADISPPAATAGARSCPPPEKRLRVSMTPCGNLLAQERDDFPSNISAFNGQPPDSHRQFKAPGTGAARIEVQDSAAHLLLRNMTVAGEDHLKSGGSRFQIESSEIMQHINGNAADLEDFGFSKGPGPRRLVNIAADGGQGRDGCQRLKNLGRTHVPGVNDVF